MQVTGSFSLTLTHVEANVEIDAGSLLIRPFVDVWISYQPTLAMSLTATSQAQCSLPPEWQNAHEKLFFLGDSGATIAIAPDASFSVSVSGTVSFSQHSYRILGFVSNPDGSVSKLDGQSSDPAAVHVSGQIKAEAYAGVQVQVGELNVIGVGMSLGGGVAGTATSDWPPQVCLNAYPYLRGTLYAYLNAWVREWKLQAFQVELDFGGIGTCTGEGWHVAWQPSSPNSVSVISVTCPTAATCFAVGGNSGHAHILRTANGGGHWMATTIVALPQLNNVACADAAHCVAGGQGSRVAVTSNGGASWSAVALPPPGTPLAAVTAVTCVAGGTCYAVAVMAKYSNSAVYSSANSGRTWTFLSEPDDAFSSMSCLDKSSCVGVGSVPPTFGSLVWPAASVATHSGWSGFYGGSIPKGWKSLTGVSCLSASLCYAPGRRPDHLRDSRRRS